MSTSATSTKDKKFGKIVVKDGVLNWEDGIILRADLIKGLVLTQPPNAVPACHCYGILYGDRIINPLNINLPGAIIHDLIHAIEFCIKEYGSTSNDKFDGIIDAISHLPTTSITGLEVQKTMANFDSLKG